MFSFLKYYWTLSNWKRCGRKRKRPHIKIGNIPGFFEQLNETEANYVVLRGFDRVPATQEDECRMLSDDGDIDILANAEDLLKLCRAVASHPGKIKLDLYSDRLVLGTDIHRVTYYPPPLCKEILENRIKDERGGFFRPDDLRYLYSFAYHLVYHKGLCTGLPSGFPEFSTPSGEVDCNGYVKILRDLASATGQKLPDDLNLLNLHLWLKQRGWNMPLDLLLHWPRKHQLLERLYKYERETLKSDLAGRKNLCVYLIREDGIKANAVDRILDELRTHYSILDIVSFKKEQQERVVRRTRGGNWTKTKHLELFLPEIAVVCQALVPFEPVDDIDFEQGTKLTQT